MSIYKMIHDACHRAASAANVALSKAGLEKQMDGDDLFMSVYGVVHCYDLQEFLNGYIPHDHPSRSDVWSALRAGFDDDWFDRFCDSAETAAVPYELDNDFGQPASFDVVFEAIVFYEGTVEARCWREAYHKTVLPNSGSIDWEMADGDWTPIGYAVSERSDA